MPTQQRKVALVADPARSFVRGICEGVAIAAQSMPGWSVELVDPEAIPEADAEGRYDGFIARILSERTARALERTGKIVVDVYGREWGFGFSRAVCDHSAIGRMAADHFLGRRYRNFAFCGSEGAYFSDMRRESFAARVSEAGFKCLVHGARKSSRRQRASSTALGGRAGSEAEREALREWIRSLPRPVAVFCCNDTRAAQVVKLCRESLISVPDDIAVLGVDNDILCCGFTSPTISSIDANAHEIGRTAVSLLEAGFAGAEPKTVAVRPKDIVPRASSETFPVDPPWLSKALVHMRRNVSRGLSASDVFSFLGLSHTVVEGAFRRILGTTVQKEIVKSRMEEACRLLDTTDLPVTEISRLSGFSSPEYFCRTFTAQNSISPNQWRMKTRSQPQA